MTRVAELEAQLNQAIAQPPHRAVEDAITVYLMAKAQADAFGKVADEAKRLIGDVMVETGQPAYKTQAGNVSMTSPSVSVSYDAKALDALAASSDDFARLLAPHRKESQRAGTMRITAAK